MNDVRGDVPEVLSVPVAARLAGARRVLVAGGGGGFDVFAGLPLSESLRDSGKEVFLANLSFANLAASGAERVHGALFRVESSTRTRLDYFPELALATWLHRQGRPDVVFAFEQVGVRPLRAAWRALVETSKVDAVVLVDGGTDVLLRGDESGLGTPAEDMASLAAVAAVEVPTRIVSCLGFGIDAFHGVCHAHVLENVAALERAGAFLGAHSLHLSQAAVRRYRDAVEAANAATPLHPSIVGSSIVSALEGRFGNHQSTARTRGSDLFVNPLMAMYWHFDLPQLARHNLYLPSLEETDTMQQVMSRIEAFRETATLRPHRELPM